MSQVQFYIDVETISIRIGSVRIWTLGKSHNFYSKGVSSVELPLPYIDLQIWRIFFFYFPAIPFLLIHDTILFLDFDFYDVHW